MVSLRVLSVAADSCSMLIMKLFYNETATCDYSNAGINRIFAQSKSLKNRLIENFISTKVDVGQWYMAAVSCDNLMICLYACYPHCRLVFMYKSYTSHSVIINYRK
jgi:hypothetical protein